MIVEPCIFARVISCDWVGTPAGETSSAGVGKGSAVRFACFFRILRAASAFANWNYSKGTECVRLRQGLLIGLENPPSSSLESVRSVLRNVREHLDSPLT